MEKKNAIKVEEQFYTTKHGIRNSSIEPFVCPNEGCGESLSYFSGLASVPEHLFCPKCVDRVYDPETGVFLSWFL